MLVQYRLLLFTIQKFRSLLICFQNFNLRMIFNDFTAIAFLNVFLILFCVPYFSEFHLDYLLSSVSHLTDFPLHELTLPVELLKILKIPVSISLLQLYLLSCRGGRSLSVFCQVANRSLYTFCVTLCAYISFMFLQCTMSTRP